MALESIVGEDPPQVGMIGKPYAVEVVGLALEPAGRAIDWRSRRHGHRFVGRDFYSNPLVVLQAEQIVDDVEALLALWPIDATDVDELLEQALWVVTQEREQTDQLVGRALQHQFAEANVAARHRTGGRLDDVVAKFLQRLIHQRTSVPVRRIFFWSCRMPYSKASAVGGQPGT